MQSFATRRAMMLAVAVLIAATFAQGAAAQVTIHDLQTRWARVNYELDGKARLEAFEQLESTALQYTAAHPGDAGGWIWSGIIKSTHAGATGGLGALGLAKSARKDLERALKIDGAAMHGSAYTSLGTLYLNVPGWPLGFGSAKKAEQMLRKGLEIDPDGIDSNYFFAEFLREKGNLAEAGTYYKRAGAAAPRPGRPVADRGRHHEIETALAALGAR
ncbi:MAG: tetratricopeptide repeat protein [Gammaproteobacteria bacterium]